MAPGTSFAEAQTSLSRDAIYQAVTNCQARMTLQLARDVTPAEAHTSLSQDGINQAVANCQAAMTFKLARDVTPET